jgi:hypothetical protein
MRAKAMMSFNPGMILMVKRASVMSFMLVFSSIVIAGELPQDELKLHAEQWELARNGEQLLQVPVLNKVVNTWLLKEGYRIELRYPGGEEGELWVDELMDWLISLGIPSKYLFAVRGSGEADIIIFKIIKTEESYR